MNAPPEGAHWRDSARRAKFFIFDISAFFPVMLMLLHIKTWTMITAAVVILFLEIIRRYGFTPVVFMRVFCGFIAGPLKTSRPWWIR